MRFLDPIFLWGLGAIAVPIVLHLLLRRRLPIVVFPLARLVARAEHVQQPRRRLNRVLLLLARAAMLALLALALARLTLGGSEVRAEGPVAAVVLVDDTLSMRATSRSGRSVFDEGRDMAESVLAALPESSQAAVLTLSSASSSGSVVLGTPDDARRALKALEPGWHSAPAQAGLEAAVRLVETSSLADRRVVVVSDLARHAFADVLLAPAPGSRRPQLMLLSPARAEGPNLAVSGLDAQVLPGGSLRAVARVSAWGEEGARHGADLEVRVRRIGDDDRLAGRGRMDVVTGAVAERRFEVSSPAPGLGTVEARLPPDVLVADDARQATWLVRAAPRLLVIDGDPQNLSFGSETFYLQKALAPGVGLDLEARLTTLPEWSPADLEGTAAVLLANAPDLSAARVEALVEAVRGGTGVIACLGNRIDQRAWNGSLADLMPASLGLIAAPPEPVGVAPGGEFDLPRVRVHRWFRLEPDPDARVLARLDDGSPLIVEGRLGEGRVLMLATSIDRDWTDLPISPWFLPFVREMVARAAPRAEARALPPLIIGRAQDLAALGLEGELKVEGPDGDVAVEGTVIVPSQPGMHLVRQDGALRAAFAAVTDPIESDLSRVAAQEIARRLRLSFDVGAIVEGDGGTWLGGLAAWKALLVALVGLLAAEAWLSRRAS